MAPQDPVPSDALSNAASDGAVPHADELRLLVAQLTTRVYALEQTLAELQIYPTTAVPAPPAHAPSAPANQNRSLPLAAGLGYEIQEPSATSTQAPPTQVSPRSLEDRLGSQIFNRIGIVAILIGATWFLKLAMDNHWIGPLGRILIGLIAGAGIIFWSERFRRREFAAFSYSLKAVGTGVLYLSLWASFQLYHLLPAEVAFGLMLLVTVWNAWMAWSQQSELLAAYAIAGAFSTPALLSTGGNHQVFLFSYLLTIDAATVALVRLAAGRSKSWSRLLIAALPTTIVYFIGWYSRFYTPDQLGSTALFVTLFFAVFFIVPFRILSHAEDRIPQGEPISDVLLPLANAIFASFALYFVLEDSSNHAALPWISLVFSAIYLAATRLSLLTRMQTAAARAVHLSLAVLFLTIAIPLKASGRWITIGWLAEGVALLWVAARLAHHDAETDEAGASIETGASKTLRRLASGALALGFFGLLVTPQWLDRAIRSAIFNPRFATEMAGIAGLALATWISMRAYAQQDSAIPLPGAATIFPTWLQVAAYSVVALNLIALQAGVLEIQTFWAPVQPLVRTAESNLQTALSISAFLMLYGAGLLSAGFWKHNAFLRWQGLGLLVIAILKTFLYDVRSLSQGYRVASFLGLGALLMAVSFAYVQKGGKISVDRPR